jgi:preprotein translocase subunit SecG
VLFYLVFGVHLILCVILVGLVLVQQGKGADLGAAFGSGSSNSVFGASGATSFITKLTTGIAVSFMITSILLINLYTAHIRNGAGFLPTQDPIQQKLGSTTAETAPVEQDKK